jgi:signal transduction histidine kinase
MTKERINFMWEKVNEKKVEALEYKLSQKELEIQKMRNDMAKDFHDEMGNKLASISILSQTLAVKLSNSSIALDHEKIKTLETIELRAQEMYQGTKDFIWSVDYKSDFVLELFIYLREFGESFFNQIDIDFKSEYKLDEDIPYRLETLMGRHCILICKEVMTNAAKYAQCSDFVFEMSTDQSTLCMLLSDNGCGFDLNTVVKRGIENINHRCSFIKAQLSIHSSEAGTSYYIKVPLFAS